MKPTPEQLTANFMGKPNKIIRKGQDGNDYDFEFQQFDMTDMADFLVLADKWLKFGKKIEDKNKNEQEITLDDYDPSLIKECEPYIKKMVKISYPDWSDDNIRLFVNNNFIFLIGIMFPTNLMSLFSIGDKSCNSIESFVEEEKKKREAIKLG